MKDRTSQKSNFTQFFSPTKLCPNDGDTVFVQITHDNGKGQNNYGRIIHNFNVVVNKGEEFLYDMTDKIEEKWEKLGKPLNFVLRRGTWNNYPFFEVVMPNDVSLNLATKLPVTSVSSEKPIMSLQDKQDATREAIIRGQCFNNACTLVAGGLLDGQIVTTDIVKRIKSLSQQLYIEHKDWLTSNE